MDTATLLQKIRDLGVPEAYYCIGGEQHESLCLLFEGGRWRVFMSQRGGREQERRFRREDEACEYFLTWLLQLWR